MNPSLNSTKCSGRQLAQPPLQRPAVQRCRPLAAIARCSTSDAAQAAPSTPSASTSRRSMLRGCLLSVASAALAAAVAPAQPAAAADSKKPASFATLADIVREDFEPLADPNKDGVVSREELKAVSKKLGAADDLPLPDDEQLDFTLRLYDLNSDGTLQTDEMLRAIALDGGLGEDSIDQSLYDAFDKDKNEKISLEEFKAGFGDVGPGGEAVKEYVFKRVAGLSKAEGGQLAVEDFYNAALIVRGDVLGY